MVVAYYRGYDANHILQCGEPYRFAESSAGYQTLLLGLRFSSFDYQKSSGCFSHIEWRKMCGGISPIDNSKVLVRAPAQWLTAKELCFLTGKKYSDRQDCYDYLCIATPKQICIGGVMKPVIDTYSLDASAAKTLRELMISDFYRVVAIWYGENENIKHELGSNRNKVDFFGRFLTAHNIPISTSRDEESMLRKMIERGMNGRLSMLSKYERDAMEILHRIYSDERVEEKK